MDDGQGYIRWLEGMPWFLVIEVTAVIRVWCWVYRAFDFSFEATRPP